ncbi:replication-relaxation family protein [Streptomyces sp. NPDC102467]|uniref:replication-relaxation family protein n=1 Tax=Streptomyces sp. NPDC102467 TaxID=3366179 RepID=UPI0037FF0E7D
MWGLTPAGLQAAAQVLERPLHEMGSTARGAASHGAAHAMAVNATVHALIRPRPDEDQAALLPAVDQAVIEARPPGLGALENMTTEAPLPITGTESAPGRGSAQADLVLCALEHNLPAVFVEVDRGTMTPARVAEKIDRYAAYFHRADKHHDLWWRRRWHVNYGEPVVMFVFTARSQTTVMNRARDTLNLISQRRTPFPVLGTPLFRLEERGPWGETWWNAERGDSPRSLDIAVQPGSDALDPADVGTW